MNARNSNHGFSLIEIMVGIAIAMVGVVIMLEVLMSSERQATTTGSGNDAMSNAAVTMSMLEHDLAQAGFGISTVVSGAGMMGCTLTLPNGKAVTMAPVVINPLDPTHPSDPLLPAGDADTDSLLVTYSNSEGEPEGNVVNSISGNVYKVQAASSFHVNDYVVGYDGSTCAAGLTLAKVTAVDAAATTVTAAPGLAGAVSLFNLGPAPAIVAYRVKSGALERCDFVTSDCTTTGSPQWTQVGANVVSLRAQYGTTTTAGGAVNAWSQTAPANTCEWARMLVVKVAVVTRSDQYESRINATTKARECDTVTTAAPSWTGTPTISLSSNASWQCYRYQTFENIVPARNVILNGANSGC